MGIYDRDYVRDEPQGIFLGGHQSVVVNLIFVNVGVFLVNWFTKNQPSDATGWINDHLALYADLFPNHSWTDAWRLLGFVTHGFAHASFWHLAGNMFVLWLFGRDVEVIYGKKQFFQLYMSLLVLAGLCWWLSEIFLYHNWVSSAVGASGAIAGVMVVFVCHYPTRVIYFWGVVPVPCWLLATIWLGLDMFKFQTELATGRSIEHVAFAAHLGGALFGYVFYRWRRTLFSFLPDKMLKNPLKNVGRPKLRLHEPDEDDSDLEERVDRILAKIHDHGADSLTDEERRTLETASRRAQQRRKYELNS